MNPPVSKRRNLSSASSPSEVPGGSSIVIYGHDFRLLGSRQLVLASKGYQVRITTALKEAAQILITQEVDLLILCHTLSLEECQSLSRIAQSIRPEVKVLILEAEDDKHNCSSGATLLHDFLKPKVLLAVVAALTKHDGLRSTAG